MARSGLWVARLFHLGPVDTYCSENATPVVGLYPISIPPFTLSTCPREILNSTPAAYSIALLRSAPGSRLTKCQHF